MMYENSNYLKCILTELYHRGIAWVQIGSQESAERITILSFPHFILKIK